MSFQKMKEIPKFYDCLEETKKEIFSLLFQGVKKRKSNFHNLVLNTLGMDNNPNSRVVILRNFSSQELTVNIHSDFRACKISEIQKNKNVSLVFYDDSKKIQLRVRGEAKVLQSSEKSWIKLSTWSRRCYLTTKKPGSVSGFPTAGFPEVYKNDAPTIRESEEGLKNFSVIKVFIKEIEWLYLASQGHRRALFEIKREDKDIKVVSKWLVP